MSVQRRRISSQRVQQQTRPLKQVGCTCIHTRYWLQLQEASRGHEAWHADPVCRWFHCHGDHLGRP